MKSIDIKFLNAQYKLGGRGENGQYDCWGFVMAVLKDTYNFDVPDYSDAGTMAGIHGIKSADEFATKHALVKFETPRAGLIVLMRGANGLPCHCGALIDGDMIVHIDEANGVMMQSRAELKERIISMWGRHEI